MLVRLVLTLLLALGAVPVAAMPAGCHGAMTTAMTMDAAVPAAPRHEHPLVLDHGCIGCAAIADWLGERIVAPQPVVALPPTALPTRLALREGGPPTHRPPRIG